MKRHISRWKAVFNELNEKPMNFFFGCIQVFQNSQIHFTLIDLSEICPRTCHMVWIKFLDNLILNPDRVHILIKLPFELVEFLFPSWEYYEHSHPIMRTTPEHRIVAMNPYETHESVKPNLNCRKRRLSTCDTFVSKGRTCFIFRH